MTEKIWVVVELRNGGLHPMSKEAITAAQQIAAGSEATVDAIVIGHALDEVSGELSSLDLAAVRPIEHEVLASYTPAAFGAALGAALAELQPSLVLFPHTYQAIDYVPRLAQQCDATLVSEVTGFLERDGERVWKRPVFAGKMQAEVRVRRAGLVFATVQAGSFSADEVRSGSAPIERVTSAEGLAPDRDIVGVEEVAGEHVDLSQADVIVSVGRGIGDKDKLPIVEELAAALGAELGASRPVIDNGWLDRDRQIGSSGQTVAPKLYLAVGISGAIQHLVGMKGSQNVVAINKDASAPIFGVANYGVVGDLFEIVPALTEAIKEAKGA